MINGDTIVQKSKDEQLEVIQVLVYDLLEVLANFELITAHFTSEVLEYICQTNLLVYFTNAYCLCRKAKKIWLANFG